MDLRVRPHPELGAVLDWGAGPVRCAVGRSGIGEKDEEGDGITPLGRFAIRRVLYRADRLKRPQTVLPVAMIMPGDGWCDAPFDPRYNMAVKLPYVASAEKMWRDDGVYDVVAVLGFNDAPVVQGKGSAIFLHVARPDYKSTEGCIALALPDMLSALAQLQPGDGVAVEA